MSSSNVNKNNASSSAQIVTGKMSPYQYLTKILCAPVYEAAINSDLDYLASLSTELKNKVYLKREDQQPVKSFKIRGAYNCIRQLSDEQKAAG
ncbi:MAG: threonine dehydratase, partial [Glaciecola sp.]